MKRIGLTENTLTGCRLRRGVSLLAGLVVLLAFAPSADAHHPNHECKPVHPRVDVIGPLGNCLPAGYRRKYNRPSYLGGKIAYWIAPSSQEAMAWHRAVHAGAYRKPKKHLRLEKVYFFPKPWQALRVGPRRPVSPEDNDGVYETIDIDQTQQLDQGDLVEPPEDEDEVIAPELLDDRLEAVETPSAESAEDQNESLQLEDVLTPPAEQTLPQATPDSDSGANSNPAPSSGGAAQREGVSQADVSPAEAKLSLRQLLGL